MPLTHAVKKTPREFRISRSFRKSGPKRALSCHGSECFSMGFRNANQGIFNTGGIKLFPNFSNGSVGVSENADIADTLSVGIRNPTCRADCELLHHLCRSE